MVRAKRKINQFTNYSNNYLMDIQTAKQIRIADYLHSLGYSPVKQQGINLWYKSPLREETEASFKVNIERNQWYDFALGKGGGTIELASHLYATDHIPYILERIAEQTPHSVLILSLLASSHLPSHVFNNWRLYRFLRLPYSHICRKGE
jgi:hypothetical protein